MIFLQIPFHSSRSNKIKMSFLQRFALTIASGFGFGYSKFASGTVGALWGIPLFLTLVHFGKILDPNLGIIFYSFYLLSTLVLFVIGVWASTIGEKYWQEKDPGKVVIDEIVGFLVTMIGIPADLNWIVAGFLICRILDIIKPWPARLADQRCPRGWGIMLDDVISGIQGAIFLNLIRIFF